MADSEMYYVAKDHPDHAKACPSEELFMHAIKGNQKGVQQYDYTKTEKEYAEKEKAFEDQIRDIAEFKGLGIEDDIPR
jgi:hypothetical protein